VIPAMASIFFFFQNLKRKITISHKKFFSYPDTEFRYFETEV
jgi:hypothetical protein